MYPQPERLFFFSLHLYDNEPSLCYRFYPGSGDRNDYLHNVMNVPLQPLWRSPAYHPPKGAANTAASSSSAGGSAKKGAASEDPHHLPPSSSSSSSSSGQHGSVHDDPIMVSQRISRNYFFFLSVLFSSITEAAVWQRSISSCRHPQVTPSLTCFPSRPHPAEYGLRRCCR